ncbi:hypothetical protein ACQP00_02165 [Dactylosporangium sp. CS-047395]|uniref:hypothetical protein n=1 Tax=Dactylosporangium sp. CS-047395 TaxID=3239936 RepID=UPI003D8F6CE2
MTSFDPAGPFPELGELRRAVLRRDWPAIAAQFAGWQDWDDHEYAARLVADTADTEGFLGAAAERERQAGDGTLARTLYGARLISAGWEVRTGARAKNVSNAQFATFHDHLRRAEQVLIEVTAEQPGNATAWSQRIKINRGLELGQAEARRRYDRLSRYVPHLYVAQANVVQQFCPKWSGSIEKVHAFGLECMRAAPPGSLAPLALLEAHFEIAFELDADGRRAHWRRPDVRAEIEEAADRSVRHPAFRTGGYRALTANNHFALAFSQLGDPAAARPFFEATGGYCTGYFWSYFGGDETIAYDAARAKAMKA